MINYIQDCIEVCNASINDSVESHLTSCWKAQIIKKVSTLESSKLNAKGTYIDEKNYSHFESQLFLVTFSNGSKNNVLAVIKHIVDEEVLTKKFWRRKNFSRFENQLTFVTFSNGSKKCSYSNQTHCLKRSWSPELSKIKKMFWFRKILMKLKTFLLE